MSILRLSPGISQCTGVTNSGTLVLKLQRVNILSIVLYHMSCTDTRIKCSYLASTRQSHGFQFTLSDECMLSFSLFILEGVHSRIHRIFYLESKIRLK